MIQENVDITHLTTFGIPVKARYYAEFSSENELLKISRDPVFLENEVLCIGGGSNLLFVGNYDGLVIRPRIDSLVRYNKDDNHVFAIAGAGVRWVDFVEWCISENLSGVENLAGIPGDVGAAPVQNVGAYGVEARDIIHAVECFDLTTRQVRRFTNEECRFGYRDSFFKHEGKGRFVVLRVSFRLTPSTEAHNLEYGPLRDLASRLGHTPTIREVADEIIAIRNAKLPDPAITGSAGSFFKNPVVRNGFLPEIAHLTGHTLSGYPADDTHTKISAAWLIDHAGMKGVRVGGAYVYENQPLVIANDGHATGQDVVALADKIRRAVQREFLIDLRPEVNYIDTAIHVRILGSGTSKGVPEIGCGCEVCESADLHDKRLRTSCLINTMGMNILIDPGPDFRQQALAAGLSHLDAVLITHSHYDHVGGLDDLRPFCMRGYLPVYASASVAAELRRHYDYCFAEHKYPGVPVFDLKEIGNNPFSINGLKIVPIEVLHGKKPINGFRIGKFAYITDAKVVEPQEIEKLKGVDTLVVNALRARDHFAHFTIDEALHFASEVKARQTYFTHMTHEVGKHDLFAASLPAGVAPAYDSLEFTVC
ncbi:MAG: UDP-N-acetylmuramate dehydrogenase [Muribaculaceae bacterium]|nr:UDP-N-acetylmuramate dehydrogenase [Muribaculaceae bacterium]